MGLGAMPISNRRATSDDVPSFSSIDYTSRSRVLQKVYGDMINGFLVSDNH
ncbi:palindromic element RPE2 domain-containing protein [Candidatus Tisiphia endosymbiont of Mystacides longicornis]|uniref:palindromic element RPE2 domain-containing protein n=1 Tax=Candidatus Tisiphia endosymbiont of Mystacides longicornis TaxID=3139330 RepID=UPI003CCAE3F4